LLILVVGGSARDFRLQKATHKDANTQNLLPTPTGWPVRIVLTEGYQIALPTEFQIKEDKQTGSITFSGVNQQSLVVSRTKTTQTDPCAIKTPGYPHTTCQNMFDTHVLDWGTTPPEYLYTIIESGYEYTLHFFGIPEPEKSKILASFRTT
jgi:hypothetical protein